jgi:hypothetical protein
MLKSKRDSSEPAAKSRNKFKVPTQKDDDIKPSKKISKSVDKPVLKATQAQKSKIVKEPKKN